MDARLPSRFRTTPTITRVSMVPQRWRRVDEDAPLARNRRKRWYHAANRRRLLLVALALAQVLLATVLMSQVLPYHGQQPLELAILVLFAILFGWVSMGFWTAMAGLLVLLRKRDRYSVSRAAAADAPLDRQGRTAVVMPIANENVGRVFAGLRATYESLARTGELAHFDFYVLSDTSDPDLRVAEATAWEALCRAVDVQPHLLPLVERALADGPHALTAQEKNLILADRAALKLLHLHALTLTSIHAEWIAERSGRMPRTNGCNAVVPHSGHAVT